MSPDLYLRVERIRGSLAVLALDGDIDFRTAPELRTRALELIEQGHPHLALDLAGVSFCDSSGLNVLINVWRYAVRARGSVHLAAVPERLQRLMTMTGVHRILLAHPDTETAVRACPATGTDPHEPVGAHPLTG